MLLKYSDHMQQLGNSYPSHIPVLVAFLSLGHNTWHPQVPGGKVYFSSWTVEVSVHSQLAPRQGSTVEEKQSMAWQAGSRSLPPSFSFYSIQATSLLVGTAPTQGRSSLFSKSVTHTRNQDKPISRLTQYCTPWSSHSPKSTYECMRPWRGI